MFAALYQGNTGVSGLTSPTAQGMLNVNIAVNGMTQAATQQAPAIGNMCHIRTPHAVFCFIVS